MVREVVEDTSGRNLGSNLDDNDIMRIGRCQLIWTQKVRGDLASVVRSRGKWLK